MQSRLKTLKDGTPSKPPGGVGSPRKNRIVPMPMLSPGGHEVHEILDARAGEPLGVILGAPTPPRTPTRGSRRRSSAASVGRHVAAGVFDSPAVDKQVVTPPRRTPLTTPMRLTAMSSAKRRRSRVYDADVKVEDDVDLAFRASAAVGGGAALQVAAVVSPPRPDVPMADMQLLEATDEAFKSLAPSTVTLVAAFAAVQTFVGFVTTMLYLAFLGTAVEWSVVVVVVQGALMAAFGIAAYVLARRNRWQLGALFGAVSIAAEVGGWLVLLFVRGLGDVERTIITVLAVHGAALVFAGAAGAMIYKSVRRCSAAVAWFGALNAAAPLTRSCCGSRAVIRGVAVVGVRSCVLT